MRTIDLLPFPRVVGISDIEVLLRNRLRDGPILYPVQAIALLGYMCSPDDEQRRQDLTAQLKSWATKSPTVPRGLGRIQHEWLRIADVLHHYYDLHGGEHQARRGGPSVGKSVALVEANAHAKGTGAATLWKLWGKYRDVAHLVTSAVLIAADAKTRHLQKPFPLPLNRLGPFQLTMVVPELVIAVALEFQRFGLNTTPFSKSEPSFDPETLWRIPAECKVRRLSPPTRKIRREDILVLNERRAGNRGRRNKATLR